MVDNSKPNALLLLESMRGELTNLSGTVAGPTVHKAVNGALDESAVDEVAGGSDLVLVASAD